MIPQRAGSLLVSQVIWPRNVGQFTLSHEYVRDFRAIDSQVWNGDADDYKSFKVSEDNIFCLSRSAESMAIDALGIERAPNTEASIVVTFLAESYATPIVTRLQVSSDEVFPRCTHYSLYRNQPPPGVPWLGVAVAVEIASKSRTQRNPIM